MSESLYFIAIIPPKPIQEEITVFKQLIADRFGSKHALNAPPHITLHMPFKWREKKLVRLKDVMQQLNKNFKPFEIVLDGFDFFEPRVVFVNVIENSQLQSLQSNVVKTCRKQLKIVNANYKDQAFHPHITVGFRDLKKQRFYEAKDVFEKKTFKASFKVHGISLLVHNEGSWNSINY